MSTIMDRRYNYHTRREHIFANFARFRLDKDSDYKTSRNTYSLNEIAHDVAQTFGVSAPSPATISNDLAFLADRGRPKEPSKEALALLEPDDFPKWRKLLFRDPQGDPYETPLHQRAWFRLIVALALKEPLPQWALDWFLEQGEDLTDVNEWTFTQKALLTIWLLGPPRHGKTDLVRHAIIWLMCRNPNIRIFFQSLNLPVSKLTSSWVKRELESNQTLISMYGPFVSTDSWSDKQLTIATRTVNLASPTLVAIGKSEGTLSRDADIIFVDDFVDEKASKSHTQVESDVSNLKTQTLTRREKWTPVLGIGSHQVSVTGDAYDYMEEHEKAHPSEYGRMAFVKIKAHRYAACQEGETDDERHGKWCLLWPTVRPYWYLEAQRHDLGDLTFEVCFNQTSRTGMIVYFPEDIVRGDYTQPKLDDETMRFRDMDISAVKPGILDRTRSLGEIPGCCGKSVKLTLIVLGFDPASGETRHAAESALIVLGGCRYCGRRYLVDLWHKRISPETHPDTIDSFASRYRPLRVRIEINGFQRYLARDPRLKTSAALRRFIIDEWETGEARLDPMLGIPVLARLMATGKFSVPYCLPADKERIEPFLRQLLRFPQKPNDIVFALWLSDLSLSVLIEEVNNTGEINWGWMNEMDDMPEYLKEQRVVIDTTTMELAE